MVGEWEVVEQSTSNKVENEVDTMPESSKKRVAEGFPDSEDARSFKLRKKVVPWVTDDSNPDLIPIKLKPKKTEEVSEPTVEVIEEESSEPTGVAPIKWTSRGWKQPEDEPEGIPNPTTPIDEEVETKSVAVPEPVSAVLEPMMKEESEAFSVKVEPPAETVGETGAVFRKRKFGGEPRKTLNI